MNIKHQTKKTTMKYWQKLSLALSTISFLGLLCLTVFTFTQSTQSAFVRTDVLLEKYKGMIEAKQVYQVKAEDWQANIDTLKAELEAAIKDYESNKSNLGLIQQQEQEQQLKKQQDDLVKYNQAIGQKAQQEDQVLMEGILNQVNAFLEVYGKEHGYTIIFGANGTGNIIYGHETRDITSEVLLALNRDYEGT